MDREQRCAEALRRFATESGRSALIRIRTSSGIWEGGHDPDVPRPAASLVKLAIGLAAESACAAGRLDPARTVTRAQLDIRAADRSFLDLLDAPSLTVTEVMTVMLGASDNACGRWLAAELGMHAITTALTELGCTDTDLRADPASRAGLAGTTTCRDALALLAAASDRDRHPVSARALRHSVMHSRIPLGATDADVEIAHKTGTLFGVAHDVAVIEGDAGVAELAFLTDAQHDTLVTGYAMGVCTRDVLRAWGISAHTTTSAAGS